MVKHLFLVCSAMTFCIGCHAQSKQVQHQDQQWTQTIIQGRVSDHWSMYFEYVERLNNAFESQNIMIFRPAIFYHFNEQVNVAAGYAYALTFADERVPVNLHEHRLWQQVAINSKLGELALQHRYRLEERFNQTYRDGAIADGTLYTFRARYKINLQYPILKINEGRNLSLTTSDEIMLSFGKNVTSGYFNQNRIFAGLIFDLTETVSVAAGFSDIFRSTSTPQHYIDINAPTLNIAYRPDLRHK